MGKIYINVLKLVLISDRIYIISLLKGLYMNLQNLLEKSRNNIKTVEYAEENQFYDVAISRYYYAIFQKIIYISKKKGFYSKPMQNENSHNSTITTFQENMVNVIKNEEITILASMMKLKSLRVKADYEEECIKDKNSYNLNKCSFNMVNEVLNKYI